MKRAVLPYIFATLAATVGHAQPVSSSLIGGIFVNLNSPAAVSDQTGVDWAHAFSDLNAALARAAEDPAPDKIWVAQGVYYPGIARADSFSISSDVSIYGGFQGTEKFLSQRNPSLYQTILDGNLGKDAGDTIKADNALHVVTLPNTVTVLLNGLTIQNGYGNGGVSADDAVNSQGAGIYSAAGSALTLENMVVQNNAITFPDQIFNNIDGGAIWFGFFGTLNIYDSIIQNNSAASSGGAIITFFSDVKIANSKFIGNRTTFPFGTDPIPIDPIGGAAFFIGGSVHINNSQFIRNSATGVGGAVAWGSLSFTNHEFLIENSTFKDNHSGYIYGALAMANFDVTDGTQKVTIKNTTFENNSAEDSTGALGIDSLNASIESSSFVNNSSKFGGALTLTNVSASLFGVAPGLQTVKNSRFVANEATGGALSQAYLDYNAVAGIEQPADQPVFGGGAIVITENADATIESSVFIGNTSPNAGAISVSGYTVLQDYGAGPVSIPMGATGLIKNNMFLGNIATTGNGGAILSKPWKLDGFELGGPVAMDVYDNRFILNDAYQKGDQIYGDDSTINGFIEPAAIIDSLKLNNSFVPPSKTIVIE